MQVEVEVNTGGIDAVQQRMKTLDALVRTFALQVLANAVASIDSGRKSGKTYRKGAATRTVKTGGKRAGLLSAMGLKGADNGSGHTKFITGWKFHRASADGEAPATDEGHLVDSGYTRKAGPFEWLVGFTASYAEILELWRNRPFLRPALESVREGFLAAMKAVFDER